MKIAIIGTGIAGNVAARQLRREHEITVFEANGYIGGHTNTVDVIEDGQRLAIDTGFIVYNDRTYPHFIRLLDEIGQASQDSEMSFSVRSDFDNFEYCGTTLNGLFAQRRNLLRPDFYRMIRDILRFNSAGLADLEQTAGQATVGEYLREGGYGAAFRDRYLVPMAASIWSAEPGSILNMPLDFLVRFFANHGLLQLKDRPQWRVIKGGSKEYVRKLVASHRDCVRLNSPVRSIRRLGEVVEVVSDTAGSEHFDAVFLACHSDQALALLRDPSPAETEILGAIRYQRNEAVLHTDTALMPRRRRAWAAWNYHLPDKDRGDVALTYNMNILQSLPARQQYCVTLNHTDRIDPRKILETVQYDHPIYSKEAVTAQQRQADINADRTFYCGAYWRNGFHEDGVVSALDAVRHFEERLADGKLHLRRAS